MANITAYWRPTVVAGVALALVMAATGLFAPLLAPHDPYSGSLIHRMAPPAWHADGDLNYVLGRDTQGRDILSRIIWSFTTNLYIGLLGTFLSIMAALILVVAYGARGAVLAPDRPRPRLGLPLYVLAICTYCIGVFLSTIAIIILGPSLLAIVVCAGMFSSVLPMTLIYLSAQLTDVSSQQVHLAIRRGFALLPMVFALTFLMGLIIESSLSFLRLGVPPPTPSLGAMVAQGRGIPLKAPWISGFPLMVGLVSLAAFWAIVIPVGRILSRESDRTDSIETLSA